MRQNDRALTLTFATLDRLSRASFAGLNITPTTLQADRIGPYLEWRWLHSIGTTLCNLTPSPALSALMRHLETNDSVFTSSAVAGGALKVRRSHEDIDNIAWIKFRRGFEDAAVGAGIARRDAKGLTGALSELEDNIHLHSESARSGLVAYWTHDGSFEFVVADQGIGVLQSLRQSPDYPRLSDEGEALQAALSDGVSRFGKNSDHGYGFHPLFVGIANLRAHLRFRSGNHLYELDGVAAAPHPQATIRQLARVRGLFVSVTCVAEVLDARNTTS